MEKSEIKTILQSISTDVKNKIKEVEDIANKNNIHVHISEKDEKVKEYYVRFPELRLKSNIGTFSYNIDDNVNIINDVLVNINYCALQLIGFDSYNTKNLTVKLTGNSWSRTIFCDYFKFNMVDTLDNTIKLFANRSQVVQFKNKEDFERFIAIADFTNEATKTVISLITPEHKTKFSELAKNKYFNEYSFIHDMAENNLPDSYRLKGELNYNLIRRILLQK
jgi:hypothetical protein